LRTVHSPTATLFPYTTLFRSKEQLSFNSLALAPALLETINKLGYTTPSPIQSSTIPHMLAGKDVIGQAQTGTGKTAAFALPTLRSEEHTSELQSRFDLVCRLL